MSTYEKSQPPTAMITFKPLYESFKLTSSRSNGTSSSAMTRNSNADISKKTYAKVDWTD